MWSNDLLVSDNVVHSSSSVPNISLLCHMTAKDNNIHLCTLYMNAIGIEKILTASLDVVLTYLMPFHHAD